MENYCQFKNYLVNAKLTRQSVPPIEYIILLGTALCVFNQNNQFIIENIMRCDKNISWFDLIDFESGKLRPYIAETITKNSNSDIENLFSRLVSKRNRIIHSFQCTHNDEQVLATKERITHKQYHITKEYLKEFIKENEKLSDMLHKFREF